ncbi:hypothetical protein [Pseudoxanthomonas daejeonensis]
MRVAELRLEMFFVALRGALPGADFFVVFVAALRATFFVAFFAVFFVA